MNPSSDLMQTLAWSLLHFLWQGAAIAALASAAMLVFRKPSSRYVVGVASLVLMLVSFIVTFSVLRGVADIPGPAIDSTEVAAPGAPSPNLNLPIARLADPVSLSLSDSGFRWVAYAWLTGVFLLALRVAFGVMLLEYLERRNLTELPESLVARFRSLQRRLGIERAIRFCECRLVTVPAVIGFARPIVLLPVRALTGLAPEQLDAVIAHELGHIKRLDVVVNFFQVIIETLFFFHPAVWWLNRRIRADREDCCDDVAIQATGGTVGYAHALATMAGWRDAPRYAMAVTGGPVAARVARLLGVRRPGARPGTLLVASVALAAALTAGAMTLGLASPAQAQEAQQIPEPVVPASPITPAMAPAPAAAPAAAPAPAPSAVNSPSATNRAVPMAQATPPARAAQPSRPAPAAKPAPAARSVPARNPSTAAGSSYIDEMNAAGVDFNVDQLVALRVHGVTPDYVRALRDAGLSFDTNALIAFKVHDVSPEYLREVRSLGYDPDADEVVALKVHDLSAGYVKRLAEIGIKPSLDQLIALSTHGVSPEYVRDMRSAGFDANTDQLIAMKVHDVSPAYRQQLESAGFKLTVDELIHARVMDISPEFIAKAAAHGFKGLTIDKLIALKNADVL